MSDLSMFRGSRWFKSVRDLFFRPEQSRARKPRPTVKLLVELLEERLTPVQIGQFSFAPGNDYTNTNSTPTNDTFGTSATGSPGDFQYQGSITGLPSFLTGALAAHLILPTLTTTTAATSTGNVIDQSFPSGATIEVKLDTPAPFGAGTKDNLISATFTPDLTSTQGSNSATLNAGTVTFTSDFLDFSHVTASAFSLSFSNLSSPSAIVGKFINSFTAAGAATFSTQPSAPLIGADLAITKAGPPTVNAGGTMTYTYTVTNNGPVVSGPVTWTDNLPAGETFSSQTQSETANGFLSVGNPAPAAAFTLSNTATSVSDTIPSLAIDATYTFTVTVNIANSASGTLVNSASISQNSATIGDPTYVNNTTPNVDTTVTTNTSLSLVKTVSQPSVNAGNGYSYTLTVTNTGAETATSVDVADALPAVVNLVSQSELPTSGTNPFFTLSNTGNTIHDTIAVLLPGQSQTFTINVTTPANEAAGTLNNIGSVTWTGNGTPGGTTTISSNGGTPVPINVTTQDDLVVTKTATPAILQGGNITYTVTVKNTGPSDAQGVVLTDPLPGGTLFQSITLPLPAGWSATTPAVGSGGTITLTDANPLAVNATATFTYVVQDSTITAGNTITNTATASSTTPDSNPTPSATATTNVVSPASLSGTIFEDFNDNGLIDGPQDVGIGGITVTATGALPGDVFTTTTSSVAGSLGQYSFATLVPDTYTLTESGPYPANFVQGKNSVGTGANAAGSLSAPSPFNPTVTGIQLVSGNNAINYNFAAIPTVSLTGTVFDNTTQNDGNLDAGDPLLNNVTVKLTGTDDEGNPVSQTITTNASGVFTFTGVRPSNPTGYTITVTPPANFTQDKADTPGSPLFGGTAAGATTAQVTGIVVSYPNSNTNVPLVSNNYLFPLIQGASVSGVVYNDVNDNGVFGNPPDTGIGNVTVTLTGTNNVGQSVNMSTTTSNVAGTLGDYSFTDLLPSNGAGYIITETNPAGFLQGTDNVGTPFGGTVVNNVGSNEFTTVVATIGGTGVNYNFGLIAQAALSGVVYNDVNDDGSFDAGDVGIGNVTVTVTGTNDLGQSVNMSTTTSNVAGTLGDYSFTGLRPSNGAGYIITETIPAGFLQATDNVGTLNGTVVNNAATNEFTTVVVNVGNTGTGYDFGHLKGATLSGVLFDESAANNGTFNAGTDPGIDGVTVTLTGTNDLGQSVNMTTTTANIGGQDGSYTFIGLRPSTAAGYTITDTGTGLPVQFIVGQNNNTGTPAGTLAGAFAKTVSAIPVIVGTTGVNYNFGYIQPDSLSGVVYVDVAGTGSFVPASDPGINGVTVTLTGTNDMGQAVNVSKTTATVGGQAGSYSFTGLRPSNAAGYTVVETQPGGYAQGTDTVPTPFGGNAPVQTAANDTDSGIVINVGNTNPTTYNFGELGSTLAGSVYEDLNNNGIRDPGDLGLNGVTVTLTGTDANGNPVNMTQLTSTLGGVVGSFSFVGLAASGPNGYTLTETQPAGFLPGQDRAGTFGGNTNIQDVISKIITPTAQNGPNYTFGQLPAATLTGTVYADDNINGTQDGSEPGLSGVTVTLTGTDENGNPVNASTTTNASGTFTFNNLLPSNAAGYTLTQTVPSADYPGLPGTVGAPGGTATPTRITGIVLPTGNTTGYAFGDIPPADPNGTVFIDLNGNGILEPNDPLLPGVTITISGTAFAGTPLARPLVAADDKAAGSLTRVTDGNGFYQFTLMPPGNYTITETPPAGFTSEAPQNADQTPNRAPVNTSVLNQFSNVVLNAGDVRGPFNYPELEKPSGVSGFVYLDGNDNGAKDTGDPGIAGVTITLRGTTVLGASVTETTTTNSSGFYDFSGLTAGSYTLTESPPAGFLQGTNGIGSQGGSVNGNTLSFALGGNALGTNNNFAELSPASLQGFVYLDVNANGIPDPGDVGIPKVTVTLTGKDDHGNPVSATTTTGNNGSFNFTGLRPGTYSVVETQPNGFQPGTIAAGPLGGSVSAPFTISNVVLQGGFVDTNNTFGELGSLSDPTVSKQLFLSSTGPTSPPGVTGGAITGQALSNITAGSLLTPFIATGADAGQAPIVTVFDAVTGVERFSFMAFSASFTGGVRVAVADVTGSGTPDIIVAAGPGGGPQVEVFDGNTGALISSFDAFAPGFTGGVYVAVGDLNNTGVSDIIVGAGPGGGPQVAVFDGKGNLLSSFDAFAPGFTGGVRVAAGDVNGNGFAEIVAAAGPGGGPQVAVFDGRSLQLLSTFFAFAPSFTGGVFVATGDVKGNGIADIIVGAGSGGGPQVADFNLQGSLQSQ